MLARPAAPRAALLAALLAGSTLLVSGCGADSASPKADPTSSAPASPTTSAAAAPTALLPADLEVDRTARQRLQAGLRTLVRADTAKFLVATRTAEETLDRRGLVQLSTGSYLEYVEDRARGQLLLFKVDRGVGYFQLHDDRQHWRCYVPLASVDAVEAFDQAFFATEEGQPRFLQVIRGLAGGEGRTSTTVLASARLVDVLGLLLGDLRQQAGLDPGGTARVVGTAVLGRAYESDREAVLGFEVRALDLRAAITAAGGRVPSSLATGDGGDMVVRIGLSRPGTYPAPEPLSPDKIATVPAGASQQEVAAAAMSC